MGIYLRPNATSSHLNPRRIILLILQVHRLAVFRSFTFPSETGDRKREGEREREMPRERERDLNSRLAQNHCSKLSNPPCHSCACTGEVNLQATPCDNMAALRINGMVDDVV